ncbi:MAG TPA: response regulator transcription factor, partial [Actinomycetota bacterium]|nr:response regulator transcription factor [Actinomycetota bacterium]
MNGVDVEGSPKIIKVMLVDDHVMFAQTLLRVLKDEADLDVVATASSVAEARSRARIYQPDVVLMDYRLPDGLGTEAARMIREDRPETKVVMLTGFPEDSVLLTAIEVGCSGYMTKDGAVQEAISAVRAAAAGEALISPAMLARLLPKLR